MGQFDAVVRGDPHKNILINPGPLSPSIRRERQSQAWLLRGREKEDVSRSLQKQSLMPNSPRTGTIVDNVTSVRGKKNKI